MYFVSHFFISVLLDCQALAIGENFPDLLKSVMQVLARQVVVLVAFELQTSSYSCVIYVCMYWHTGKRGMKECIWRKPTKCGVQLTKVLRLGERLFVAGRSSPSPAMSQYFTFDAAQ